MIHNGALDNDITAAIDAQATAGRITAAQATAAKAYLGATRP
jgi:acid phosphatase class B